MEFFYSIPFKYLLPIILLGIQFSLKFFVDRKATAYNFAIAMLEIPISIFFITLSLIGGFIVAGNKGLEKGFLLFIIIIPLLIFGIFFWRRSVEHFEKKNFGYAICLGFLNYTLSIPTILLVVSCLIKFSR